MFYNPVYEFETLKRVAEEIFSDFGYPAKSRSDLSLANIYSTDQGYMIQMAAAGIKPESVEVSFTNGILNIAAKREKLTVEKAETVRSERSDYEINRSFNIRENIDSEKIDAKAANGLLMIYIPKKPEALAKRIEVKVN